MISIETTQSKKQMIVLLGIVSNLCETKCINGTKTNASLFWEKLKKKMIDKEFLDSRSF